MFKDFEISKDIKELNKIMKEIDRKLASLILVSNKNKIKQNKGE